MLYGLDLAKRDISRGRQVVVVEGYTDVMACHLAGVTTAVATCGTAFGVDHIKVIRRMLGDVANVDSTGVGEVVFTFDPDAAGQKAASRAFAEEQRFAAQTFVAIGPEGLDPCDLRLHNGDDAVRRMVDAKKPMFEFMIRRMLAGHDLETVEGRVAALRAAAPVVLGIRDSALHTGYVRDLAGWLGLDPREVQGAVNAARAKSNAPSARPERGASARPERARAGVGCGAGGADAAAVAGRSGHPPGAGRADGDPAASRGDPPRSRAARQSGRDGQRVAGGGARRRRGQHGVDRFDIVEGVAGSHHLRGPRAVLRAGQGTRHGADSRAVRAPADRILHRNHDLLDRTGSTAAARPNCSAGCNAPTATSEPEKYREVQRALMSVESSAPRTARGLNARIVRRMLQIRKHCAFLRAAISSNREFCVTKGYTALHRGRIPTAVHSMH